MATMIIIVVSHRIKGSGDAASEFVKHIPGLSRAQNEPTGIRIETELPDNFVASVQLGFR